MVKSVAERVRKCLDKKREAGYVKFCLWVKPAWKEPLKDKMQELASKDNKK